MRARLRLTMLLGGLLLPGCTAMGQWVYDDPSFALRGVAVHPQAGADSLELVFVGCNRNDYEVTSETFATQLRIAGQSVGAGERERPVHLPVRDSTRFSVMIPVSADALESTRDRETFAIDGSTAVNSPIGVRRLDFRLRGRVKRVQQRWEWAEEGDERCRPGMVALPPEFSQPIRRDDPGTTLSSPSIGERP